MGSNPIDKKGDVNVDGVVNVADISAVISLMAGYGTGLLSRGPMSMATGR